MGALTTSQSARVPRRTNSSADQGVDRALKSKLFRGFADPSRLAILEVLTDGPLHVTAIARRTGLSQPNTSMHLACLEDCGLVTRRRRGQFVEYAIARPRVVGLLRGAERLLDEVGAQIFRCTRYEPERR